MAEPITFEAVRRRYQIPPSAKTAPEPTAAQVLAPDELVELYLEDEERRMAEDAAKAVLPKAQYDPDADAAVLDTVVPQEPPEMVEPPTLHTRAELDAAVGSPEGRQSRFSPGEATFEPPTYSRPIGPRGDPPFEADTGEGGGIPRKLLKGIFTGADIFEGAARGAAAAEGAGSFLAGAGRASEAIRSRRLQEDAHQADQRASAARTSQIEAKTAMLPQELAWEQQAQEISNYYRQKQAEYMESLSRDLEQRTKLRPQEATLNRLRVMSSVAANRAREATQRRLMQQGHTPEEAARLVEQAEMYRAQQEYYRSGAGLREAQQNLANARAADLREGDKDGGIFGSRSPDLILSSILTIQEKLEGKYKKTEMQIDPTDPKGKRERAVEVVDQEAMQKDPDYEELQFLRQEYRRKTGREPGQATTPGVTFDPERIRRRVLEMMKR